MTGGTGRARPRSAHAPSLCDTVCKVCGILLREPCDHRRGNVPFALTVAPCCPQARGMMQVGLDAETGRELSVHLIPNSHLVGPTTGILDVSFCPFCGNAIEIVEVASSAPSA